MGKLRYLPALLGQLFLNAWVNRGFMLLAVILLILVCSVLLGVAQVAAPYIYTLF
jgi:hypothetical protein